MKSFIYFTAPWCGKCKSVTPLMDELSKTHSVQKVDVDANSSLAQQYGIMGIPTVVVIEDGKEVNRIIGARSSVEAYLQ